jgi:2-iminobutanoate/2-iminopropanoate deaminase
MSSITTINPSAHLPLSSATIHNGTLYVSGQVGFKPGTTQVVSDDVSEQCRRTFEILDEILKAAGTSKIKIIRSGVYLKHVERDFAAFNACYAEWMGDHRPARSTIEANMALPEILVEIDCVAALD